MPSSGPVPLARVLRSGVEESVHLGSVAVARPDGSLVAAAGDPETVAFARSSLKPLQAAVSLRAAGEELPHAEVAVMAASHNGEPVHVEAVEAILRRAGLDVSALRLPPAFPMDPGVPRGPDPAPILRDCSGKHAGMLLASARRGWDVDGYLDPGHPVQRAVLAEATAAAGQDPVAIGIDGCGTPVPAFPLRALARAFAGLGEDPERARVAEAMRAEPYLVAGRDRVCTDLMRAIPGLVAKVGAEGLLCLWVADPPMGVAIKALDGSPRALAPASVTVLQALGVLAEVPPALERWARPTVLGGGAEVGRIEPAVELVPT